MDDLLGIDLIDCAGDNLAAIAPMVIFPASADKRVVTRYGEVTSASFARPGSATYVEGPGEVGQVGVDVPRVGSTGWILEGSATSYYAQTYTTSASGILTTNAPTTQTITLPATGAYVLWIEGNAGLSVTVAAGTAVGTGFGSLTKSGYLPINITTAGTVTVTVSGGAVGDQVQLTTGAVKTSYIPTPTTSPVTRASEGADTSGNGLSIPLSRAMIDSLTGELSQWTDAWSHVSGTAPTYSGGNKVLTYAGALTASDYHALLVAGVSVGDTIEVSYTISGYSDGSFALRFGSGMAGVSRTANGAYIERGVLTGNTNLYVNSTGLTGVITINYVRRVLENGQVNRGEGTICQWVDIPWPSSVVANSAVVPIMSSNNTSASFLTLRKSGGGAYTIILADAVLIATITAPDSPGRYIFVSQWSAALGRRMRVGLWNPATRSLTWSSPTLAGGAPYRGFFPTHSSNRLRWGCGLGALPIGIGPCAWFDSILTDDQIRLSKEMLP